MTMPSIDIEKYNGIMFRRLYTDSNSADSWPRFLDIIVDPAIELELQSSWQRLLPMVDEKIKYDELSSNIHDWIEHNPQIENSGLTRFINKAAIIPSVFDGLSESFIRYQSLRLRHLHGEYIPFHLDNSIFLPKHFAELETSRDSRGGTSQRLYIDNDNGKYYDLDEGDWVLISLPFYPAGDHILMYDGILNQAQLLGVPVVVDCSLFPYTENMKFNFAHPAITEVLFNLSMGLGITDSTIGVRYSNYTNGFLNMKHEHGYILDTTKALISHLLDIVPSDYFVKKCSTYRDEICDDFGFTPTNVVSLCLASYEDEFFLDRDSSPYPTVNISMALTKKLEGTYNVK